MSQTQPLSGQVAAVTGAASGIGFASAQAMVATGAQVLLIDRDAQALAKACETLGAAALPLVLDLLDPAQCAAMPERILGLAGRLDVFHANAGLYVGGDLVDAQDDAIPVLLPCPIDLEKYRDVVLNRFGNPAIADTNQRVAMDAFSKIPGMIAPTIRDKLARGGTISSVSMLPALFLAYLQRWHAGQIPYTYQDQAMDPAVAHAICEAADPVAAYAADATLWGELAGDPRLVNALRDAYTRVRQFIKEASHDQH